MTGASPSIGCIVLAAGSGTRFGSDKRLAAFGTDSLIAHTLANIRPAFDKRVLVLRADDTALAARFAADWDIVYAVDAGKGMGHSVAAAMTRTSSWDGAIIALADMPFVKTSTFADLRTRLTADTLVVPYFRRQRGNPVGIGKRYFAELARLTGDQGARVLLQQHAAAVISVEVEDSGVLRDVDTPAELGVEQNG